MKKTTEPITYAPPVTEDTSLASVQMLCESPLDGGIEDIEIEVWITG